MCVRYYLVLQTSGGSNSLIKVTGDYTNSDTSIEEHFTVRPKSKILDYRILKSYIEEELYIVEIEAIVGNISMDSDVCNNNKPIIIKEYKGSHSVNTNIPPSFDSYSKSIIDLISNNLNSIDNISYYDNKTTYNS